MHFMKKCVFFFIYFESATCWLQLMSPSSCIEGSYKQWFPIRFSSLLIIFQIFWHHFGSFLFSVCRHPVLGWRPFHTFHHCVYFPVLLYCFGVVLNKNYVKAVQWKNTMKYSFVVCSFILTLFYFLFSSWQICNINIFLPCPGFVWVTHMHILWRQSFSLWKTFSNRHYV